MDGRMIQRVAYGAAVIVALVAVFTLDAAIGEWAAGGPGLLANVLGAFPFVSISGLVRNGSVLPLFLLTLVLVAALELGSVFKARGVRPHLRFAYLMITIVFLSPWLATAGWFVSATRHAAIPDWSIVFLGVSVIGCGFLQVSRWHPQGALQDATATVFMILYLGFLPSFALKIRCDPDNLHQAGVWLLLITLLVSKASDIAAYFGGSLWGRHKLCPHISPGKSVEGVIFGLLGSILVTLVFAVIVGFLAGPNWQTAQVLKKLAWTSGSGGEIIMPVSLLAPICFGFSLSFVGQLGDLFESCLKRDVGIKDSGSLIPQYGGILDLVDSPIFATPMGWFLVMMARYAG